MKLEQNITASNLLWAISSFEWRIGIIFLSLPKDICYSSLISGNTDNRERARAREIQWFLWFTMKMTNILFAWLYYNKRNTYGSIVPMLFTGYVFGKWISNPQIECCKPTPSRCPWQIDRWSPFSCFTSSDLCYSDSPCHVYSVELSPFALCSKYEKKQSSSFSRITTTF